MSYSWLMFTTCRTTPSNCNNARSTCCDSMFTEDTFFLTIYGQSSASCSPTGHNLVPDCVFLMFTCLYVMHILVPGNVFLTFTCLYVMHIFGARLCLSYVYMLDVTGVITILYMYRLWCCSERGMVFKLRQLHTMYNTPMDHGKIPNRALKSLQRNLEKTLRLQLLITLNKRYCSTSRMGISVGYSNSIS